MPFLVNYIYMKILALCAFGQNRDKCLAKHLRDLCEVDANIASKRYLERSLKYPMRTFSHR